MQRVPTLGCICRSCCDPEQVWVHCVGRWAATLGIVLAVSRAFIAEAGVAFEPELALLEVVAHTHWLPRHWRGRAHTQEVQQQFQELFQFKVRRLFSRCITTSSLTWKTIPRLCPEMIVSPPYRLTCEALSWVSVY